MNPDDARLFAEAVLRTTQQPFLVLNGELKVEIANPAFYRHFDATPEETTGRLLYDLGNGQWDIPELRRLLEEVIPERKEVEQHRVEHEFESIGRRVMLLDADRMEREEGHAPKILLAISDVTETERTLRELEGQKEYAEKIVDTVRDPLLVLDWDLRVKTANQPFYQAFQVDPAETEGRMIYELGNGQWDIPRLRDLLENVLPDNDAFDDFEVEHDFEEIGHRIMLLNARRVDHVRLILLAIEDVTERRRHETRQDLLMGELQHRVKNILMNVQSLARQTRRHSGDLDDFIRQFDGRLSALGRTQDLLLRGSGGPVLLGDLLRLELEALGAREGKNLRLDGPAAALPARAAQPMAMAVHELATNAAKHGALARSAGRIEVTWRIEKREGADHLRVHWRERGVEIPAGERKRGFGTEMIESSMRHALGGTSELTLHPDGAECRLEFPLEG